jgi:hypothetical protein
MGKSNIIEKAGAKSVNLLLMVASRLEAEQNNGRTNLYKSLYFIDALSYVQTGKQLSTFKYVKAPHGPMPDGRFDQLRRAMIDSKQLREESQPVFGPYMRKRLVALVSPDSDAFNKEQTSLISQVVTAVGSKTANDISEFTHDHLAWQLANIGDTMPMSSFILQLREPTEKETKSVLKAIEADVARNRKGGKLRAGAQASA